MALSWAAIPRPLEAKDYAAGCYWQWTEYIQYGFWNIGRTLKLSLAASLTRHCNKTYLQSRCRIRKMFIWSIINGNLSVFLANGIHARREASVHEPSVCTSPTRECSLWSLFLVWKELAWPFACNLARELSDRYFSAYELASEISLACNQPSVVSRPRVRSSIASHTYIRTQWLTQKGVLRAYTLLIKHYN